MNKNERCRTEIELHRAILIDRIIRQNQPYVCAVVSIDVKSQSSKRLSLHVLFVMCM